MLFAQELFPLLHEVQLDGAGKDVSNSHRSERVPIAEVNKLKVF